MSSEYIFNTIIYYIQFIYYLELFVLSIYGAINYKYYTNSFKYLVILIVISFLSEITEYLLFLNIISLVKTYHFSLVLNLILFYYIFKTDFKGTKFLKIARVVTIVGVLFSVYSSIFIDEFNGFPSNGLVVLSVISIGFSLFTLKQIIDNPTKQPLFTLPKFWLSISVLFFFTLSYIQLTFYQIYFILGKTHKIIYISFKIIIILYYIGLFLALHYNKKHNYANQS